MLLAARISELAADLSRMLAIALSQAAKGFWRL
jgi:hypothetical protein